MRLDKCNNSSRRICNFVKRNFFKLLTHVKLTFEALAYRSDMPIYKSYPLLF